MYHCLISVVYNFSHVINTIKILITWIVDKFFGESKYEQQQCCKVIRKLQKKKDWFVLGYGNMSPAFIWPINFGYLVVVFLSLLSVLYLTLELNNLNSTRKQGLKFVIYLKGGIFVSVFINSTQVYI